MLLVLVGGRHNLAWYQQISPGRPQVVEVLLCCCTMHRLVTDGCQLKEHVLPHTLHDTVCLAQDGLAAGTLWVVGCCGVSGVWTIQ